MRPGNNISRDLDCSRFPGGKSLAALLDGLSYRTISTVQPEHVPIFSVTVDSRDAKATGLFVALAGTRTDGHRFLAQVISKGCRAIVIEEGKAEAECTGADLCTIAVKDSRAALAVIAANFYNHPSREMIFIGITGTNGKTTITYLLEHILEAFGLPVGVIGTVNYRYSTPSGKTEVAAPFTTPEPLILQGLLRTMAGVGVRYVLMEVSSHALLQHRLGDIRFDVAAFTNLSHDHLDYHADMEEYFTAKTRLFTDYLKEDGRVVITCSEASDDVNWQVRLARLCVARGIATIRAGGGKDAQVRLVHADSSRHGTAVRLTTPAGEMSIASPLVGGFNVDNLITTIGTCQAMGLDLVAAAQSLASATGAPGRLQRIMTGDDLSRPLVFVDYAHTPDALRQVLMTLAALPHRNLFCVFGCGGDRDRGKRPVMGAIAARICDVAVVTDDNPRSESSGRIIEDILSGIQDVGLQERNRVWLQKRGKTDRGYLVLPAREEAIAATVMAATAEDIVLIAGKGHEKYQISPAGKRFFDDCLEAREALLSWNCTSIGLALTGSLAGAPVDTSFRAVSTDSRTVGLGDIFVALRGGNFDGHDFLPQVIEAGAGCLVISREDAFERYTEISRFLVKDTQVALGALAGFRRRLLRSITRPLVIGITGSCGKTTVKEMTAAILERQWPDGPGAPTGRVLKTRGNFNNLIGLPLSLLPLGVKHRAAILEMGMNHPGEIADLARIAEPDISCIVSIHAAHLEGLHSLEGVAAAKEELFAGTGDEGFLVVNLDDEHIRAMAERYRQKKITYSATEAGCTLRPDLWASDIVLFRSGAVSYILHTGEEQVPVTLSIPGGHNVGNSLAAAAIALAAGCTLETIAAGLADFRPGDKRMVITESQAGYAVINDTYNANPGSMAAGLATLRQLASGTSMAILGDMLELGEASRALHNRIGRQAAEQGVGFLALFGQFAPDIRDGAVTAGMAPEKIRIFAEKGTIVAWVGELAKRGELKKGDYILIKASRGMRFETIVQQLTLST